MPDLTPRTTSRNVHAMENKKKPRGCLSRLIRWCLGIVLILLLVASLVFCAVFRHELYNRFVLFPKQAEAWKAIQASRTEPTLDDGWSEFRGVMHNHTELSHDSSITFPEIVAALHKADVDFIFLSDHCDEGKADYSLQWTGLHDGIIFIPGFEMAYGFMPWGLPRETVLDSREEPKALAKQIHDLGGLLFFAHVEEEREWSLPELTGMEIYNIHPDFEDENMRFLAPNILFSIRSYPDQVFRLVFDRPKDALAKWDELNLTRKIVGIGANDAHNNVGVRGFYTADDTLLLLGTGGDDDKKGEWPLGFFSRLLLRLFFGSLEPGKMLFRFDLDPYERSARFVNTHLLAPECSEQALLDAVRQGRAFVAFDVLADARGFVFLAQGPETTPEAKPTVMGETIEFRPGLKLRCASPQRCRFTIVRDGKTLCQYSGNDFTHAVDGPGKYRVEAELDILGEWTPWVYTNPIEVAKPLAEGST